MGRLQNLFKLVIDGLMDLSDPPRNMLHHARDCVGYLNSKLRPACKFYCMKLMVLGKHNRGKTTLVARLQGLDVGINQLTIGVDISKWHYAGGLGRRKYQFSIWDLGGQEEYYAFYHCFLSERSMYLLVWNVKHGEQGVQELKPWLDNIALRAPHSCVLIVGTHLDCVEKDDRPEVDRLLEMVADIAQSYQNRLVVPEVLAVGLMNRLENIGTLREAIYNQATEYKGKRSLPIMGQEIPASYLQLNKKLEKVQEEVRKGTRDPVMNVAQFRELVHKLNLPDICSDEELRPATLFLNDIGTILHYDDRSYGINELYFIDPRWLYKMISEIVTVRKRNPFVKNGILHSKNVPFIFHDPQFQWQYFERYLTLLYQFEIALPLNNRQMLIPSMLPDERPDEADITDKNSAPLYIRFINFQSPFPPGFWSRLISCIMRTIPQVCSALDSLTNHNNETNFNEDTLPGVPPTASMTDDTSAEMISHPILSPPQNQFLLPNITCFIVGDNDEKPLKPSDFTLLYWKEGIVYKHPELSFGIESLQKAKVSTCTSRDGIVILASPNSKGRKLICQLVDIILDLIHEWYPGLEENNVSSSVEQRVPCYECRKLDREKPFEFKIDQYMPIITSNRTQIECGYEKEPSKNHNVFLVDIMPDLLLQELDSYFLLKPEEIEFQEDRDSLLGEGEFGKVYRGKCRGKSVAIKKYLTRTKEAFNELRFEAKMLQKSHHPCIICIVGVSVHPLMALILEEAPMGSLERHIIKKSTAIPRLVMFRIAAQVAAALRFLHQHGIIFRDLKAANILLWSLDENSLCHSKVTNLGTATHLAPVDIVYIQGTKGFIAPEVLYFGQKRTIYNHKADIFSFGMLLYQMIARCHPFHNVQPVRIDIIVVQGERPSTFDTPMAETGYFFLTRLMEKCWEDKPDNRPETSDLIRDVSNVTFQSIMGVLPVKSRFSLRQGCAITPHNYMKANVTKQNSELWICYDGSEGTELNIFNTNRMAKRNRIFIKRNQVQCMYVCGDHIWVCSHAGREYGVIDIFSIITRELVHNIQMKGVTFSCITCSNTVVYLGTLEGYCYAFDMDLKAIQNNCQSKCCYISEYAIDGIIVTKKHMWVSHTHFLSFLNLKTLTLEHTSKRNKSMDAFVHVGHLALSSQDSSIAWSAHLGGTTLSAWDTQDEEHLYDIDVREVLLKQVGIGDRLEYDAIMTCMSPALDVVWVGMATGQILLFHEQEMIMFFHPYTQYLRFLITVPCKGPCQKEKCMVVSGAKGFQSPVEGYPLEDFPQTEEDKSQSLDNSSALILWEAYSGATLRQMKIIEEKSPGYLDNHKTVAHMIKNLQFKDDTHIIEDLTINEGTETSTSHDNTFKPFETSYTNISPCSISSMYTDQQISPETSRGISLEESSPKSFSLEPIENPTMMETHIKGKPFLYKIDTKQPGQSYAVMNKTSGLKMASRVINNCLSAIKNKDYNEAVRLLTLLVEQAKREIQSLRLCQWSLGTELSTYTITISSIVLWYNDDLQAGFLHLSSRNGWLDMTRKLIEQYHFDPREGDNKGNTSPHYAAAGNQLEVMKYFTSSIDQRIRYGGLLDVRNYYDATPLHIAAANGSLDVMKYLIEHNYYNSDSSLRSVLHYGAEHINIVKYLITKCNCDPMARDKDGSTFLHLAVEQIKVLKYLITKCNCNPMVTDNDGKTVLHYAVERNHLNVVEYLLSTGNCDPLSKDNKGRIPLQLTNSNNQQKIQSLFKKFGKIETFHPVDSYVNVLLLGNPGAGKSTLSHVINDTATGSFAFGSFRNVKGVEPCTAGIIPHKLQHKTLGNIILHDFAGHSEYYSSHSAVIENLLLGSGCVFLIVVNILEKEAVKQLHQWLTVVKNEAQKALDHCHIIIVASHVDELSDSIERRKREEEIQEITKKERCDSIYLDCRKLGGSDMGSFFNKLSSACESIRSTSGRNLSLYCHMMYGLLEERNENILTLSDVMSAAKDNDNYVLPDKREEALDVLHSLGLIGLINVFKSEDKVWVIVNKGILLSEVNGILFAPETFKKHVDIASNTGIVSVSGLISLFPDYNPDMLICFLQIMELCQEMNSSFLETTNLHQLSQLSEKGDRGERLLFFPSLLYSNRPDEMASQVYQFGWCLQCTGEHHFFSPRYFHVLSLHLAYKFAQSQGRNKLNRCCTFWRNGIHWFNGDGVGVLVEIVDESQCVLVLMSYQEGCSENMVCLRREVIGEVVRLYKESCPSLEVEELVIDPEELSYPVKTPRERTVHTVYTVLLAAVKGQRYHVTTKIQRELKSILTDESVSDISNLSLLGGRDIKVRIHTHTHRVWQWLFIVQEGGMEESGDTATEFVAERIAIVATS